jgi:hypothetical protein
MGGNLPIGYDLPARGTRVLRVNEPEAKTVRHIFMRYLALRSVHSLQRELARDGIVSRRRTAGSGKVSGGQPFNRGALFHLLRNPIYLGRIRHKNIVHEGGHEAIVDEQLFEQVQRQLERQAPKRRLASESRFGRSPLTGKLFDAAGEVMSPSHTAGRHSRPYRYYVSASLLQGGKAPDDGILRRVSGPDIEKAVAALVARWLPSSAEPLQIPLAIRLHRDGLLVDLPGKLTRDIAHCLLDSEQVIHSDREVVRILVPLGLPLRGGKRVIIAGDAPPAQPDPSLIAALRKAHGMLSRERGHPVMESAPTSPHDRKLLRLAFLAPDLQRDILAGRQPPSLNLEKLRWMEIPLSWKEQREVLGWGLRQH